MESIEQQIYASLALPGLKPGHHTHAHTDGLDAASIEQHERICNQWGEYEPGADFTRALVQMPLWRGAPPPAPPSHYAVIYITYQGRDAGGRPGALLRHIVRLPADVYASLDYNPFHLQRHVKLLSEWTPQTPFPAVDFPSDPTSAEDLKSVFPERYALLRGLLTRLLADGEVHLPAASDSPAAEELFAELLEVVPVARRQWVSLATFAYKNAANFALAAMRHEEASFRRSLEAVQDTRLSQLPGDAAGYVTDLFAALDARDWGQAASLVRRSEVGALTDPVPAAAPAPGAGAARASGAPGMPGAAAPGGVPFQVRGGPPPPAPPLPSSSARRRRSRAPAIAGIALLAVLAVAAFLLTRRGGEGGPVGRRSSEQIRRASAASVAALIDEHERILADMLAQGARDFDLTEAMTSAVQTLPDRAQAAVAAEGPAVEESLRAAAGGATSPAGLRALAARLGELAQSTANDAARLHGLRQLLLSNSPARLRAAYDPQQRQLRAPAGDGDAEQPVLASLFVRAQALQAGADALRSLAELAPTAGATDWGATAASLRQAADSFPEEWPAPAPLTQLAEAADAVHGMLSAERAAGLEALALAVPYRAASLRQGELAQRAVAVATIVGQLRDAQLPAPARLTSAAAFYALAGQLPAEGRLTSATAEAALEAAAGACADDASGGACAVPSYAAHLARWKLEAWRALGGPESAVGRAALERMGAAALPDSDAELLPRGLAVLEQLSGAPVPAPPALAEAVAGARGALGTSFYGRLCDDWLLRNRRQAQSQQAGFKDAYARLQAAAGALRSAGEGDAAAALRAMSAAVQRVQGLDLAQAEAVAAERAKVQAAKALVAAWNGPAALRVDRLDVQLLTESDYSGTRQQMARPRITVSRVADSGTSELLSALAPPMLAAPGTGFAAAKVAVGKPMRLAPQDRLWIVGKDEGHAAPWFHVWVDPPREGHVAALLAAGLKAKVTPEQAAQIAAAGGSSPQPSSAGAEVASIRFVFGNGWWQELANALPALP